MPTEPTVTITMERKDAEEVALAVRLAAHYQLSGTDTLAERTTAAIESALSDALTDLAKAQQTVAPAPPDRDAVEQAIAVYGEASFVFGMDSSVRPETLAKCRREIARARLMALIFPDGGAV